nr:NAD-dependent epimerase/dehydratase [Actinoplanes missouriensis]
MVLGATGFLGSAVTAALARQPVRLRVVARRPVAVPAGGSAIVETRRADLLAPGVLAGAVAGADVVLPFAARIRGASGWRITEDDEPARRTNVDLIDELAGALGPVRGRPPVVVFPGSNTQVGKIGDRPLDGTEPDHPQGVYDRQKHAAELILKQATAAGRLRAVSVRLPPVFGPAAASTADDRGIVSTMARRALAGEPLTMWHDGTVRRDLLFVDDAVRAFRAAIGHADALAGRHYLIGTGQARPLGEVFRSIAASVARRTGRPPVPVRSVPPPAHAEESDFRSVDIDPAAFMKATGWRCTVPIEDALDRTVEALAGRDRDRD